MDPRVIAALLLLPLAAHAEEKSPQPAMKIATKAFSGTRPIPERFTADGKNINPPLTIGGVPPEAKSLVLIVDDPDAPMGTWNHWLVWNIKPGTTMIEEDSVPKGAVVGRNDAGSSRYFGPSPPRGTHRYFFRLYALDILLDLSADSDRSALDQAMRGHVIAQAQLLGRYGRE